MKRTICLLITLLGGIFLAYSQPILTRSGSYTYIAPPNQSPEIARKAALERAKLQIIENEYGTVVGVSNISRTTNVDGESTSSFLSLGETEVKGEWISTVGTPSFEMSFQGESMVIKVTVTGKIREITSSSVSLDIKILRNGINDKNESDVLKNEDDFFVLFKSPVKGYVAVYQYDSDGVFRLLPYKDSELASIPVKAGKEYVFFEDKSPGGVALRSDLSGRINPSSYYMATCSVGMDLCRYYVIFSPNNFSVPNDESGKDQMVATIDFDSFQRWLGKIRKQDTELVVVPRDITLRNK